MMWLPLFDALEEKLRVVSYKYAQQDHEALEQPYLRAIKIRRRKL